MCHLVTSKRKPHNVNETDTDRQKGPGLGINQLTCHALQGARPVSTTACLQPNITQTLCHTRSPPISPSSHRTRSHTGSC